MPNISQLTNPEAAGGEQTFSSPPDLFEAEVITDAASAADEIRCIIPAFSAVHADDGYAFQPFVTGAGVFFPKKRCRAVVAFPDEGEPFIAAWWPLSAAAPDEPFS